jgi:RNA polymerase sigma-70 factor (ECF subfamily)
MTVWSCYRTAKKDRRRLRFEVRAVPDPEPSSPFDGARALADRDLVERELNELPLDHRAVIVLRFYLDLPLDAVADILDIPVGTAKSRLHRAIASLRASMVPEAIPFPVDGLKDGTA